MEVFIVTDELKKAYTEGLPAQVLEESDLFFGAVKEAKGADPDMSISYCIYNPRFLGISDLISDHKAEQTGVSMTQYYEF